MQTASATTASGSSAPALTLAGLAALLASGCCVLPLVLALAGISGAWTSQLRVLAPFSNGLIALAVACITMAGWRIFRGSRSAAACPADGQAMDCSTGNTVARRWFWLVALLTLVPLLAPLLAPLFY